ncbi:hypothetical protein CEP53_007213 [Fusarium sp. AF-6]|nr:hypothetical protein CEP53_007213 [Fusarium sp. AF-6]
MLSAPEESSKFKSIMDINSTSSTISANSLTSYPESVGNAITINFTVWKNGHACQGKESLSGRVGYGSGITVGADALPVWDSFKSGDHSGGGFIPDPPEFLFYEKANCKGKLRDRHPKYYDAATQCIGVGFRSFEIL